MTLETTIRAGLLALCLASSASAATGNTVTVYGHRVHHTYRHSATCSRTVDVAASPLPPLPTTDHVCVVDSAEHPIRHGGVAGVLERAHRQHMRLRAFLYRNFLSGHR